MSEEGKRHSLGTKASDSLMFSSSYDLATHSKSWEKIARDLENMASGQFCLVTGTEIKDDPNAEYIEKYERRLSEALGDSKGNYELTILHEDEFHRLKVRRK